MHSSGGEYWDGYDVSFLFSDSASQATPSPFANTPPTKQRANSADAPTSSPAVSITSKTEALAPQQLQPTAPAAAIVATTLEESFRYMPRVVGIPTVPRRIAMRTSPTSSQAALANASSAATTGKLPAASAPSPSMTRAGKSLSAATAAAPSANGGSALPAPPPNMPGIVVPASHQTSGNVSTHPAPPPSSATSSSRRRESFPVAPSAVFAMQDYHRDKVTVRSDGLPFASASDGSGNVNADERASIAPRGDSAPMPPSTTATEAPVPDWLRTVNQGIMGTTGGGWDVSPTSAPLLPHTHVNGSHMHITVSGASSEDWLNPCTRPREGSEHGYGGGSSDRFSSSVETEPYHGDSQESGLGRHTPYTQPYHSPGHGAVEPQQQRMQYQPPQQPVAATVGSVIPAAGVAVEPQGGNRYLSLQLQKQQQQQQHKQHHMSSGNVSYASRSKDGTFASSNLSSMGDHEGFMSIKHAQHTMTPVSQREDSYLSGSSVITGVNNSNTGTPRTRSGNSGSSNTVGGHGMAAATDAHGFSPGSATSPTNYSANGVNGARDGSDDHLMAPRRPKENNYFNNVIMRKERQRQQSGDWTANGDEDRGTAVAQEAGRRTSIPPKNSRLTPVRAANGTVASGGGETPSHDRNVFRLSDAKGLGQQMASGADGQPQNSAAPARMNVNDDGMLTTPRFSGISLPAETTFVTYGPT